MGSSGEELPCVGRLEVANPKPAGFLCGTLPVLADATFATLPQSALVPSTQTIKAPRYQMLPTETDLNSLPLLPDLSEKVLPDSSRSDGDLHWEGGLISQNISKKCEALAVYSLTEHGDEIDVVSSTDILKQIFKIPYSKSQVSIAVQRIGDTLILNSGPDIEEGEKMFRRQSSPPRASESSIFLNFAMHSVRAEACDCPPSHYASSMNQPNHNVLPGRYDRNDGSFTSSTGPYSGKSQFLDHNSGLHHENGLKGCADYSQKTHERVFWGCQKKKNTKGQDSVRLASQMGGKSRCSVKESEKYKGIGNDDFLRVLVWQFHNFRMLLGSDLLMFSNEKYVAVSLHLWDIARQVTPQSWLEAWLDNVMAGIPELAVCYHRNGVVQGYELLKTDDISLLKGISEDGTPAFHPQVVQQNGLSVLRFLQKNCKQDPGAYWLYKSAGDDVIQLFDLSVLPKNTSADEHNVRCDSLSSLMHKGRKDSLFTLGTLLYRIAHRLSLSKVSDKKAKCAKFFKKCLDFLHEQDHLVIRAYAHEQFARLILRCYEDLDLTPESFLLEYEATVTDVDDQSSVFSVGMFGSAAQDKDPPLVDDPMPSAEDGVNLQSPSEEARMLNLESNPYVPSNTTMTETGTLEVGNSVKTISNTCTNDPLAVSQFPVSSSQFQTITDPISSRLAAIHHVSQAIKSLRWTRQLQTNKGDPLDNGSSRTQGRYHPNNLTKCACGDPECIEVCDIREWLTKAKMDCKLWKLVLLLGESYLALGEAYMEDNQFHRALKVIEVACSVYGSMPQYLEDAQFTSSMDTSFSSQVSVDRESDKYYSFTDTAKDTYLSAIDYYPLGNQFSSNYLFWAKVWTLVGDIFVEYHRYRINHVRFNEQERNCGNELRMSNEVVREVTRLKKKLGRYKQNCSICSLINCSCQSDRASSGYSASSSGVDAHSSYSRKASRKANKKHSSDSILSSFEEKNIPAKISKANDFGSEKLQTTNGGSKANIPASVPDKLKGSSTALQIDGPIPGNEYHMKRGGIFQFLEGPKTDDADYNLCAATYCYEMARKSLGVHVDTLDIHYTIKKKGWVCNELGRLRLNNGSIRSAELAFQDAIRAFKEVSDHSNIILINCNMGHGRRALAEEVMSTIEELPICSPFNYTHKQSLKNAKLEYIESLKYYKAAKDELIVSGDSVDLLLQNELYTQYANTYLRLGMLLTREINSEELYGSGEQELRTKSIAGAADEGKFCSLSACDAFKESLQMYESVGESRRQEAAFAHFQFGCYYKASCLKFLEMDLKSTKLSKGENTYRQRAKLYASTAERHWHKAIDFYHPKTHPTMFLKILVELSALCDNLTIVAHSNKILESALSHLFEGRHTVEEAGEDSRCCLDVAMHEKFWNHLQSLLKKMLAAALSDRSKKLGNISQQVASTKEGAVAKLREMYRMSLKSNNLNQLHAMYKLWIS